MKKVKVTFWLLGFGCGIALAGMIGTLLSLRIDVMGQQASTKENTTLNKVSQREESQNPTDKQSVEGSHTDLAKGEEKEEQLRGSEVEEAHMAESSADSHTSIITTDEETLEKHYEVFIPNNSSASQICSILEEVGVVESGKDFLTYIKEHKKQTRLKDGKLTLPVQADYETLLALLLA